MTGPSVDVFSTVRAYLTELCSRLEIHWTPMMLLYTFLFSRMGGSLNPKLSYNNRNIGIRNKQMSERTRESQVFVQCYTLVVKTYSTSIEGGKGHSTLKNGVNIRWVILSHFNDSGTFHKRFRRKRLKPSEQILVSNPQTLCLWATRMTVVSSYKLIHAISKRNLSSQLCNGLSIS